MRPFSVAGPVDHDDVAVVVEESVEQNLSKGMRHVNGVHLATVGRIVRGAMQQCANTNGPGDFSCRHREGSPRVSPSMTFPR